MPNDKIPTTPIEPNRKFRAAIPPQAVEQLLAMFDLGDTSGLAPQSAGITFLRDGSAILNAEFKTQ